MVRCTIIDFLERHHLLSRTAATALRHQSGSKKRKQHEPTSTNTLTGSAPLDYISRVKTSRPSRTSQLARQVQAYEDAVGVAYQSEINLEDELEFELDADWMASMLDVSGILLPQNAYFIMGHSMRVVYCYLHNTPMTMHALRMISYRKRWNTHDEDLKGSYYLDPHRRALLSLGMFYEG